jgi:hypothetical protein
MGALAGCLANARPMCQETRWAAAGPGLRPAFMLTNPAQVLSLKKRVLEDALARRTSRSPSRSSHGAGRLVTTSTQPEYQF